MPRDSPPPRGTDSYRPTDRRRTSPSSRPSRRSRSRSPSRHYRDTDHYSPRRSPRPLPHDAQPLSYDESAPPLPDEAPPPLPASAPPFSLGAPVTGTTAPSTAQAPPDDGWEPVWEPSASAYYFYNRFTGASQWENPRIPEASVQPEVPQEEAQLTIKPAAAGGYNPAIHGSYDPNADYARQPATEEVESTAVVADPAVLAQQLQFAQSEQSSSEDYTATATFNRFTGRFQTAEENPGRHSDDAKAKRQMNAFFDVDAAANAHDGRSLRAERQQRRLTKEELKAFRERNRERKEQKRRAWLRD